MRCIYKALSVVMMLVCGRAKWEFTVTGYMYNNDGNALTAGGAGIQFWIEMGTQPVRGVCGYLRPRSLAELKAPGLRGALCCFLRRFYA